MEKVWISDAQRVTLELLGGLAAFEKRLNERAAAGEKISQGHYWACLAELSASMLPPGTHYLRAAYDRAQGRVD